MGLLAGELVTLTDGADRQQLAAALVRHLLDEVPYGEPSGRPGLAWIDAQDAVEGRVRSPAIEAQSRRLSRLADHIVERRNQAR
ncbi:MAG: hypothetical protein AB8I08_01195 [Sandaracinaceae bacterium]